MEETNQDVLYVRPFFPLYLPYSACIPLIPRPLKSIVLLTVPVTPWMCNHTNCVLLTVGPIVEAFGTDRILYASSGSTNAGDWYELAREVVAELGVEQEAVDAIFGGNANGVFVQSA
jgi:hypothetical protein